MTSATDFFTRQDQARKKTGWLVFYFCLAIVLIIMAIYGLIAFGLTLGDLDIPFMYEVWNPYLFGIVSATVGIIVFIGTMYKLTRLSRMDGGMQLAESVGGVMVNQETNDLCEKRLLNIVEEMAIASGVAVPPVYIINDDAINAFAAGYSVSSAVIAVTTGALNSLNREELQGVIAHEFSHILNGDMRLNVRLVSILHGIIVVALIGTHVLRALGNSSSSSKKRSSSKDKDSGGGGALLLILLVVGISFLVVGFIGEFFARLIQKAVCREREFLADASAVQFTRNPQGIANALKKVGALTSHSFIAHSNAKTVSHLFFADGMKRKLSSLLSTHPDLGVRIKNLDSTWDGNFPEHCKNQRDEILKEQKYKADKVKSDEDESVFEVKLVPEEITKVVGLAGVIGSNYSNGLSSEITKQAHTPFGARAVIYGLLLDADEAIREKQITQLVAHENSAVVGIVRKNLRDLIDVRKKDRLPLLDIALSSCYSLSPAQWWEFIRNIEYLINADNEVSLFEWMLKFLVNRQYRLVSNASPAKINNSSLSKVTPELSVLIYGLAWFGCNKNEEKALESISSVNKYLAKHSVSLVQKDFNSLKFKQLGPVLEKFAQLKPMVKKIIFEACVECIGADKYVGEEELELLRVIGNSLDCPVPRDLLVA